MSTKVGNRVVIVQHISQATRAEAFRYLKLPVLPDQIQMYAMLFRAFLVSVLPADLSLVRSQHLDVMDDLVAVYCTESTKELLYYTKFCRSPLYNSISATR